MTGIAHVTTLCIPPSHPALPGHFPGRPLVPGVVLLDHVLARAEDWLRRPMHLRTLRHVKFLAPLLPQQHAVVEMTLVDDELRFVLKRGEELIAQGAFKLATEAAA